MKHSKRIIAVFIMLAAIFALSACGKIEDKAPGSANSAGNGPVKEFTVHARSTGYDVQEIRVNQGDTVQITLKNDQGMHSLKIKGYNKEVRGGKTITFVADKAGEFEFACNISCGKNHKLMTGKLIVK
ncbi:cupredoxin domain-containing protein [Paenibacillus sp. M1]|uniref:Cupredoxin domain-containing protein n=1 Tax=Paenibacillus haidiansis TaxID=1574488 RepID=A0ABU7VRZ0_9BACL